MSLSTTHIEGLGNLPTSIIDKIGIGRLRFFASFNIDSTQALIGYLLVPSLILGYLIYRNIKGTTTKNVIRTTISFITLWILAAPFVYGFNALLITSRIADTLSAVNYHDNTETLNFKLSELNYTVNDHIAEIDVPELAKYTDTKDIYVTGLLAKENLDKLKDGIDWSNQTSVATSYPDANSTITVQSVVYAQDVTEPTLRVHVTTRIVDNGWDDYIKQPVTIHATLLLPQGSPSPLD